MLPRVRKGQRGEHKKEKRASETKRAKSLADANQSYRKIEGKASSLTYVVLIPFVCLSCITVLRSRVTVPIIANLSIQLSKKPSDWSSWWRDTNHRSHQAFRLAAHDAELFSVTHASWHSSHTRLSSSQGTSLAWRKFGTGGTERSIHLETVVQKAGVLEATSGSLPFQWRGMVEGGRVEGYTHQLRFIIQVHRMLAFRRVFRRGVARTL